DVPHVPAADRPGPGRHSEPAPLARRPSALLFAAVVPRRGPWREEEQDPCALFAGDGATLVGLEGEKRAGLGFESFTAGLDADASVDDQHEGVLFDLVLAELLPWIESDQDCPRRVVGIEHDRGATPFRSL